MSAPGLERRIEAALCPGEFVSAQDSFDLVEEVERVRKAIAALLPKEKPPAWSNRGGLHLKERRSRSWSWASLWTPTGP